MPPRHPGTFPPYASAGRITKSAGERPLLYSRSSHTGGMPMELTDSLKTLLIETAKSLKGSARRLFMARTGKALGPGGPQRAARALRWGG